MKIVKTVIVTGILALGSTSAFAASGSDAPNPKSQVPQKAHVVKPPVLIESGVHAPKTPERRANRIMIEPVGSLDAREASTSDNSRFIYKLDKRENTITKTYRPSTPKSEGMPNLFKK